MKKFIQILLIVFFPVVTFSQWQSDVRLTNAQGDSFVSLNNSRCLAAFQNLLYAVWADERDGNREIYFKMSSDNGQTWGSDLNMSNNSATSWRPCIASLISGKHIVWCDNRDGNFEIYYRRSMDNGVTWQSEARLTNTSDISWAPSLAVNQAVMHLVWEELISGNEEIFYKKSTDNGTSWSENVRLTNDPFGSFYPSVAVSGSSVHITWYDFRPGHRAIFYKRSTDAGETWGSDTRLTFSSGESYNSGIAVNGQTVHIAFHDTRTGNEDIYYLRSSDNGTNWTETQITNTPGISWYPSISVSGSNVHLAWYDTTAGNYEIYYGHSTDAGLSWLPNERLTFDTARSYRPCILASDTNLHLIWNDGRDGNLEVYYKRNPHGNTIAVNNISSEIPEYFYLSQNYPNPFNPSTTIEYSCIKKSNVEIRIFDITGKQIARPLNRIHTPGKYSLKWNAVGMESGVYLYALYIDGISAETRKMLFIK